MSKREIPVQLKLSDEERAELDVLAARKDRTHQKQAYRCFKLGLLIAKYLAERGE